MLNKIIQFSLDHRLFIILAAILLMVAYWVGWTSSNLVLSGGLLLVVLGAILHIRAQKKGEKY